MTSKAGPAKLGRDVAEFRKTFRGIWQRFPNAKANEKMKMTDEVLRLIEAKPSQFVSVLLQRDADCVSRLVSSVGAHRQLLGKDLPGHFQRFLLQVRDAVSDRGEEEKGRDPRLDRIVLDLERLPRDPVRELHARLALLETGPQLHALLRQQGQQVLQNVAAGHTSLLKALLLAARKCCATEDDAVLVLRWLRCVCAASPQSSMASPCLAFCQWCNAHLPVAAAGRTAMRRLLKCCEGSMAEPTAGSQAPVVDDKLRKKLLGSLYMCTSEGELAKMFPQVRTAVLGGQVGDYLERLTVALVRKARSLAKSQAPLTRDVHDFLHRIFRDGKCACEEVRAFMVSMPRQKPEEPPAVVGGKRRRALGPEGELPGGKRTPQRQSPQAGPKDAAMQCNEGAALTRKPPKSRNNISAHSGAHICPRPAGSATARTPSRTLCAVKRRTLTPLPAPQQLFWAEGTLDLKQLLQFTVRKYIHDEIFDL